MDFTEPAAPSPSRASSTSSRSSSQQGSKKGRKSGNKQRVKKTKVKVINEVDPNSSNNVGQVTEDEYIVEKIVGKKYIDTDAGRILHYFIKWKGWAEAHNTWEPKENLKGCKDLLDKFHKSRKAKRNDNGLDSDDDIFDDKENDDDEFDPEIDRMMRTRKELIEYGIETTWPANRIPEKLVGAVAIDKHLCYLVKCKTEREGEEIDSENCLVVRATAFREKFSGIVIKFYEDQIKWVSRDETPEELSVRAAQALHDSMINKSGKIKVKLMSKPKIETEKTVGDLDEIEQNGGSGEDTDKMEVDDDDDLPKIFIKTGNDLFGMPENLETSSSSDDDNYDSIFVPVKSAK